jgi:drug/metabolite transporter (DMT)-like permease
LVGAVAAFSLGDRAALRPVRLVGIGAGLGGVALLVGGDLRTANGIPWWSVAQVMLVCVGYATAPFIVSRRLGDVPSMGVVAVSLVAVAIVIAPPAWLSRPTSGPPATASVAVLGLAVICTGLAFVIFFALIGDVGPARATLITFANPAVAVTLGALFLDEQITAATIGGFILVLTGCWLATRPVSGSGTGRAAHQRDDSGHRVREITGIGRALLDAHPGDHVACDDALGRGLARDDDLRPR